MSERSPQKNQASDRVSESASGGVAAGGARPSRRRRWRGVKDGASKAIVSAGGISVIVALGLIFVYLLIEVVPLFAPASASEAASYPAPGPGEAKTLHIATERHLEYGVRFTDDGAVTFFETTTETTTGAVKRRIDLPIPEGVTITSFAAGEPRSRLVGLGLSDGTILLVRHTYEEVHDPEVGRIIHPDIEVLFGDGPVEGDGEGRAIVTLGVQEIRAGRFSGSICAAIATDDGRLRLITYQVRQTLFGDRTVERDAHDLDPPEAAITRIMVSMTMRDLVVGDDTGRLHAYDISTRSEAHRTDTRRVVSRRTAEAFEHDTDEDATVTALAYLLGTESIIVGGSDGTVHQFFLVRDDDNVRRIRHVRSFPRHAAPVTTIVPEYYRKGFLTADESGVVNLHYATSHRTLLTRQLADGAVRHAAIAPRNNAILAVDEHERLSYHHLRNPHPQTSLHALWQPVWYEGYGEPEYRWESSSATDEFEPKFSLVPLTLGTLKAAFYAMLFATPLAIMGAVYSAYFMSPKMRGLVKPSIEIMEALPTVILGFLAGLWFAPFVENHLPAVFSVLLVMPAGMLAFGLLWTKMPPRIGNMVTGGWEAAALIPVVLLLGGLCVWLSPMLEVLFFDGDMRQWFTDRGITYDQRNALVVGVAMGFAVIPTIFSMTEDAIFNVPRHLTQGSLALGATPWQTMCRIVILTASPGVFSAVMIGLGRAVGETMIVLMATGNSPVTNFNMFEGMRTLSANIAVEMPETEVGGTHYRILFLSALVLFAMTFIVNTVAEVVRQRLRRTYASL